MIRKAAVLVAGFSTLLILTISAAAQEDRLQVVASHTILADVVANIAGDAADVTSLMPVGADPHSFVPTPSDLARLADADVVFVNGALFEEGLLETVENAAENIIIVEASQNVPMIPFGEHLDEHVDDQTAPHEPLDCTVAHEDEHEDEADESAQADEHDHEAGGCDPHVWWNPLNVVQWTLTIRDTLSEHDPGNASIYSVNADAYIEALESLENDELRPLIETLPEDKRILVTDHDSLGYFANAYGFEVVGVVVPGGSTIAESSAMELAAVIDTIREQGVRAIVVGTTVSPALSEQIANEAGAVLVTIYTDSLSDADGAAPTYLDFMRYNVQIMVNALNS